MDMDEILKTIQAVSFIMFFAPILTFITRPDFDLYKESKIDQCFKFASMKRDMKLLNDENWQKPLNRKILWLYIAFEFCLGLSVYLGILGLIVSTILRIFF